MPFLFGENLCGEKKTNMRSDLAVVEGVGPVHGIEPTPPGQLVRLEPVDRAADH